jgi:Histidine kinase-, DNA gyrase B-, and HSP90-like ATPase
MDKLFQPFWRNGANQNFGGLGLGLHICDQIVRAHHGSFTVTSERNRGTTFAARLPLSEPAHRAAIVRGGCSGERRRVEWASLETSHTEADSAVA